jgi:hypothetical protein
MFSTMIGRAYELNPLFYGFKLYIYTDNVILFRHMSLIELL